MNSFWHPQYLLGTRGAYSSIFIWKALCFGSESPDKLYLTSSWHKAWASLGVCKLDRFQVKLHQKMLSKHLVWSAHSIRLNLVLSKNCTQKRVCRTDAYFHSKYLLSLHCTTCSNRDVPQGSSGVADGSLIM